MQHAKQSIDFAVALLLFVALCFTAALMTTRHISSTQVDPVKFGSF